MSHQCRVVIPGDETDRGESGATAIFGFVSNKCRGEGGKFGQVGSGYPDPRGMTKNLDDNDDDDTRLFRTINSSDTHTPSSPSTSPAIQPLPATTPRGRAATTTTTTTTSFLRINDQLKHASSSTSISLSFSRRVVTGILGLSIIPDHFLSGA